MSPARPSSSRSSGRKKTVRAAPLYRDSVVGLFLDEDTREGRGTRGRQFSTGQRSGEDSNQYLDDMLEKQILSRCPASGDSWRRAGHSRCEKTRGRRYLLRNRRCGDAEVEAKPLRTAGHRRRCEVHSGQLRDRRIDRPVGTARFRFRSADVFHLGRQHDVPCRSTAIKQILAELRNHVRRFRLSFDYMAEAVISKTTGDPGITSLVESFATMGAPWLSGIRDIRSLACELSSTSSRTPRPQSSFGRTGRAVR